MKIDEKHLYHLRLAMRVFFEKSGGLSEVVRKYETGNFPLSDKLSEKDLSKRFCADCYWLAVEKGVIEHAYYSYLSKEALSAALSSFLPKLVKRY